jgi:tetratricopeptide (TPR) repeat protein
MRSQLHVWRTNLSLWEQAVRNYPQNWYAIYNRAKLISKKDPDNALNDLNHAIDQMQHIPALFFARGTLLMEQGKHQEAIADFTMVLAKKPDHTEALINRGNAYRSLKRYQESLADYNTILSKRNQMVKALNNRGLTYLDLGSLEEAEQDFTNALSIKPDYPSPYLNRGNVRLRPEVANYTGAVEDYTMYLNLVPQHHDALFRRGYARLLLGQPDNALEDMNTAIKLHSSEGFYYVGRSKVYEALNNPSAAQADLETARRLGIRTDAQ